MVFLQGTISYAGHSLMEKSKMVSCKQKKTHFIRRTFFFLKIFAGQQNRCLYAMQDKYLLLGTWNQTLYPAYEIDVFFFSRKNRRLLPHRQVSENIIFSVQWNLQQQMTFSR